MDPSTRLLLRSPNVSAAVLGCVMGAAAWFAWTCTRWRNGDAFAELPVHLGGYALLGWVMLVAVAQSVRWWRRRDDPGAAFEVAIQGVLWTVLPAVGLWLARST